MSLAKSAEYVAQGQPRPQGLLLVQNGGRRRLLNTEYSTNRGVFCHVTHDEMAFSEVVSSMWRPCLFSAIGNRCSNKMKTFHHVYVTKFERIFGATLAALARGFSVRHCERGEGPGDEVGSLAAAIKSLQKSLFIIVVSESPNVPVA